MALIELGSRRPRLILCGSVALTLATVSGCRPASTSGSAADNLHGLSPIKAVQQAYDQLSNENYRADFSQDTEYDTSGLAAQMATKMAASLKAKQSSGTEVVESSSRLKMAIQIPVLGKTLYLLAYDGTIYASADNATYQEAPFLSGIAGQLITTQTSEMARHLQDVHDVGRTNIGTSVVEHYTGSLTADYLRQLIQNILGGLDASGSAGSLQAAATTGSTLDFFIDRQNGQVVRELVELTINLDMGKLAAQVGKPFPGNAGVLKVLGNTKLEFHDFGKSTGLSRPASTGQLTPTQLNQLLQQ